MNLNFAHSQSKLDRISARVHEECPPQELKERPGGPSLMNPFNRPATSAALARAKSPTHFTPSKTKLKSSLHSKSLEGVVSNPEPSPGHGYSKNHSNSSGNDHDQNDAMEDFDGTNSLKSDCDNQMTHRKDVTRNQGTLNANHPTKLPPVGQNHQEHDVVCPPLEDAFRKSCTLCGVKFPLSSLENKVLFKHILTIRHVNQQKTLIL